MHANATCAWRLAVPACTPPPRPALPPPLPPQQAKSEIASLTDVAATNAEVMQEELLHHQVR